MRGAIMRQMSDNKSQPTTRRSTRNDRRTNGSEYDDFMRQYGATNQTRDERLDKTDQLATIKRRRKRRLHWLEITVIALGAITVVTICGVAFVFWGIFTSNQPQAPVTAFVQPSNSDVTEYIPDDVIISGAEDNNEIVGDCAYETSISEVGIGDEVDDYAFDDTAIDYEITISYQDTGIGDNDVGEAIGDVENSQHNESIFLGGSELNQHLDNTGFVNYIRQLSFFIESKLNEYIEFHYIRPELTYEYVVWKVNAGLNRDFFENPYTITDPHPFLVNPFNRLPYNFSPSGMARIDGTNMLATPETIRAFNEFQAYARTHGHDLRVASAYRSISDQRTLYANRGHLGTIARPGHSEHHTGRAIDLWGPLGLLDRWQRYPTSETALWVADNAYKFGFIIRYTIYNDHITGIVGEPWHITYVTEYVSRTMRNNGYGSLEEFVARNPSFVFRP